MLKQFNDILKYSKDPNDPLVKNFLNKIESNYYKFSEYPCPICENQNFDYFSHSLKFGFSICKHCGLVQISNRISEDNYDEFYNSGEYQQLCMNGLDDISHFYLEYSVAANYIINVLKEVYSDISGLKIYEIGCGSGGILLRLKEIGLDVKGSDLDKNRVSFGNKFLNGLLKQKNALKIDCDFSDIDIILLSHMLEYVFYPELFLMKLRQKINNSNTRVMIDVPDLTTAVYYSKGNGFLPFIHIGHIWYFSLETLEMLMNKCGFKLLTVKKRKTTFLTIWKIDENANFKLKNYYLKSKKSIALCEKTKYLLKFCQFYTKISSIIVFSLEYVVINLTNKCLEYSIKIKTLLSIKRGL